MATAASLLAAPSGLWLDGSCASSASSIGSASASSPLSEVSAGSMAADVGETLRRSSRVSELEVPRPQPPPEVARDQTRLREWKKQQRVLKNRESAARSRAKRQQYTAELEEQVNKLKKENVNLKREVVLKGEAADASKHSMRLRSGRSAPPAYFHKQLSLHETIEELKKQQRK